MSTQMLDALQTGDAIEVRCHFTSSWASGFEVDGVFVEAGEVCYRIRRASDGHVLPAVFPAGQVRDRRRFVTEHLRLVSA